MRSSHDCILTSSKTIINDNPQLTCRIGGLEDRSPARIILDKELNIPMNSKIVKESNIFSTIIFYNEIINLVYENGSYDEFKGKLRTAAYKAHKNYTNGNSNQCKIIYLYI